MISAGRASFCSPKLRHWSSVRSISGRYLGVIHLVDTSGTDRLAAAHKLPQFPKIGPQGQNRQNVTGYLALQNNNKRYERHLMLPIRM